MCDVKGSKPIAGSQSVSDVSAVNPLVAFYDIHGGNREVLFFYFVPNTIRDSFTTSMEERERCYTFVLFRTPQETSCNLFYIIGDDEHNRCHFPSWIVDHHKWFSLDHSHQYHFTTKNATLKVPSFSIPSSNNNTTR
jgi:hypothetical protein